MNRPQRSALSIEDFAKKLAPVLGNEHALQRVNDVVKKLAYRGERLTPDQQRGVLAFLGEQEGLAAAAARHLLRQFNSASEAPRPIKHAALSALPPSAAVRDEIVDSLSRALGDEKAKQVVDGACKERGILPSDLNPSTALDLLEHLACTPGIVGVTARFSKVRLALKFTKD